MLLNSPAFITETSRQMSYREVNTELELEVQSAVVCKIQMTKESRTAFTSTSTSRTAQCQSRSLVLETMFTRRSLKTSLAPVRK